MALHRQSLSPTANLLRNSRLFSLPNPLPRPPVSETFGAGISKASDSATLPYPTHQAITTTKSSLARGDWGLKRPLPSRSHLVQVSDPVLRINQLDTIEHVTDFDSAADHVRTRQKWEEMSVPMMKGMTQMRDYDLSGTPPSGAFEARDDTTSYDTEMGLDEAGLYLRALKLNREKNQAAERKTPKALETDRRKAIAAEQKAFQAAQKEKWEAKKAEWDALGITGKDRPEELKAFRVKAREERKAFKKASAEQNSPPPAPFSPFSPPPVDPIVHNTKRWKHEGPWLPGLGAERFTEYLAKEISKRRGEFNTYLVEFVKNEIYTTRRLAASKSGKTAPMDIQEAEVWHQEQERQWALITNDEVKEGIKALRKETANNPLGSKLVTKLIMPFLKLPAIKFKYKAYAADASSRDIDQYQFDQETAPLSTHPSAGLGYLRSKSYIANHPILGPQSSPSPIPARVIQPRTTSTTKEVYARLGVGGFVANDQFRSTDTSSGSRANISNARDVETIDLDTVGGKKVLVQPMFGSVTNDGRIHIKLKRSSGPEVQVARGELDDKPPMREGFDSDPLRNLGGTAKSGIKELDEQSARAKQLNSFLDGMNLQDKAV
ncbi:mitochondrial ribosomal protein MRP51 [Pyrenochaeta sp. MPI-SDFR-AT-0127]|nr:mitochondrial ribosomal protein MRP51 [Pyrenochaeta sp. MPI-SDFR-AT-0127]